MHSKPDQSRGFIRKLILIKIALIIIVGIILYLAWPN
jgi:hypothetical protein